GSGGGGSSAGTASSRAAVSLGAGGAATATETLPRVRGVASPDERSRIVTSREWAARGRGCAGHSCRRDYRHREAAVNRRGTTRTSWESGETGRGRPVGAR